MRATLVVTAIVILGGAASAGAQSNSSGTIQQPVFTSPSPAPPPPVPAGKSRAASPLGNPGNWVTTNDYPTKALREEREGTTGFRVAIGSDGRPTACDITFSSGSSDLDAVTCQLILARAMFRPALDFKGKPTTGSFSSRIRWVIPNEPLEPREIVPSELILTFTVEADGMATNCGGTSDGKPLDVSQQATICENGIKIKPFVDSSGKPVRKRVTLTQSVTVTDPPN